MNRRSFLASSSSAALAAAGCRSPEPPEGHAAAVRVVGVEVFRLKVNRRGNWVIARVLTDAGLSGIGDASHAGRGDPQVAKLNEYAELMKGRGVYDVEWLREKVHPQYGSRRDRNVSCALAAIEQALFDIQGQIAGVPCYQLFGGKLRDEARLYANINRSTGERDPQGFAKMAATALEAGFDAVKMAPFDGMPRDDGARAIEAHAKLGIACADAVREVIGPDRDLLIDAHSQFDLARGLDLLKRLEHLNLFWLEEVTRPLEDLARIREAAPMPTAGGESLFGVRESLDYMRHDPVGTLMPDVKYCGGMLELKKISAIAEAAGMKSAPHGPASPVGNLSAAHVCLGLPNFQILEYSHGDAAWRAELLDPPERIEQGRLQVSDRPGLGAKLNEKILKERAAD